MSNPVLDLLHARRSTRAISTEPLPETMISELMEAARWTPSCANKQPWRYLFITTPSELEKAHTSLTGGNVAWVPRAPLLIVGYSRAEDDCTGSENRIYHQFDLGMATMNIMLAATHLGLVARPMAGFEPGVLREYFDFADEDQPLVMVAVGFPGDDESHVPEKYKGIESRPRIRKPVEEIIRIV